MRGCWLQPSCGTNEHEQSESLRVFRVIMTFIKVILGKLKYLIHQIQYLILCRENEKVFCIFADAFENW